ncbi:hypothetical protein EKO27_g6457 [Xylaria grammica]|uniref:Transcription factor Opi1 n=1 Tax=Xylaria grammica TaxID=363999 RepID=A0A439D2I7_9PEZI|nr:hypothetical protein EKO27_g6457 [Xylaria grammica]
MNQPMNNNTDYRRPSPPRPPVDDRADVLLHYAAESRKHPLALTDESMALFERIDRPFNLAHYPPVPPPYSQTRDTILPFSDAQAAELAPIKSASQRNDEVTRHEIYKNNDSHNNHSLPSISSITAAADAAASSSPSPSTQQLVTSSQCSPPVPPPLTHWPSLNPLTAYYTPSHVQNPEPPLRMDVDTSSNGASSAHSTSTAVYSASPDRFLDGRASSVSLDDPDVRMAAEALGDLKAERTIDSATSAYTSSKNYYPRIKTSIEYVEGYVVPIANTVGSVGRVTGVETGVRWFLRRTKPHGGDLEEQGSSKRRKVGAGDDSHSDASPAPGSGTRTPRASLEIPDERRLSMASTIDVPPEYDEFRAPPYTKQPPGSGGDPSRPTWHSRLIVSTSGLSIAMSEESLRSLKYCLSWIRWANAHIGHVVNSLTITMEKYEQGGQESGGHDSTTMQDQEDRSQLAAKIGVLNSDVLRTLQDVINTVSRYAGGALPENARELVRQHLTSLPQRFHLANQAQDRAADQRAASSMEEGRREQERREETQTRESARRAILLAKEGLDMMWQVSQVLNGTIVSAEEWCERLSNKKKEQREDLTGVSHSPSEDTKMG